MVPDKEILGIIRVENKSYDVSLEQRVDASNREANGERPHVSVFTVIKRV